jgi:hypothetical protein
MSNPLYALNGRTILNNAGEMVTNAYGKSLDKIVNEAIAANDWKTLS